jgi:hypothetical protein
MRPGLHALPGSFRWLFALGISAALQLSPATSSRLVAAELPVGATLTVLAEPVEVAPVEVGTFAAAVAGQALRAGDVVRTGPSGLALLTFFDGSESQLGSSAQVQVEQADYTPAPQIALLQTSGVSVNRVIPLPPGGSFRTDTPDATGLVRGTSYVVSVGSDTSSTATSVVLLTDRDGHVGHVSLVPASGSTAATAPVELVHAGDCGASSGQASQLNHDSLARLEGAAQDLRDVGSARQAHEEVRQVLRVAPPAAAPPAAAGPAERTEPVAEPTRVSAPSVPAPSKAEDRSEQSSGHEDKPVERSSGGAGSSSAAPARSAAQSAPAAAAAPAASPKPSTPPPATAKSTPAGSASAAASSGKSDKPSTPDKPKKSDVNANNQSGNQSGK